MNIVQKLQSLHHQATEERSHYYVGSVALEAATEIINLRSELEALALSHYTHPNVWPESIKTMLS